MVIVDEGHLLDHEMLEEIRFLLNFKLDSESPMALILVGQSELWDLLKRQVYTAVRQRLDLRCSLYHYDRTQTADYVFADTLIMPAPAIGLDSIDVKEGLLARQCCL